MTRGTRKPALIGAAVIILIVMAALIFGGHTKPSTLDSCRADLSVSLAAGKPLGASYRASAACMRLTPQWRAKAALEAVSDS